MEFQLMRREFISVNLRSGLSFLLYDEMLNTQELSKNSKKQEQNRLRKLEYLLNPPEKESYEINGIKIKYEINHDFFALITPENIKVEESRLFEIINYDSTKPPKLILTKLNKKNLYIVSRNYIDNKIANEKLRISAKYEDLPIIYPTWTFKNKLYVPTNIVIARLYSTDDIDKVIEFAQRNGLKHVQNPINKKTNLSFELTDKSNFSSPFEASRKFNKNEKIDWCFPDSEPIFIHQSK